MTPRELLVRPQRQRPGYEGLDAAGCSQPVSVRRWGGLDRRGEGLFDKMNGIGAHEVIIESPRHEDTLASMDERAVEQLSRRGGARPGSQARPAIPAYVIIFKNHGAAAGASLEHSHTQLIALPIVPREVRDEVDGSRLHFQTKERCVFCDILQQEATDGRRLIAENADVVALPCMRRGFRSKRGFCRSVIRRSSRTRRATSMCRWPGCWATSFAG